MGDELKSAQDALLDLEDGARKVEKEEAKQEVDDLSEQVEKDTGYIKDTEEALAEKKKLFKERKKLRMDEIAAISEAIGVLRDDDARDTFKKSMDNFLFFQRKSSGKVTDKYKKFRTAAATAVR